MVIDGKAPSGLDLSPIITPHFKVAGCVAGFDPVLSGRSGTAILDGRA